MKTKRNGNIELLRFIFAMFVVFLHADFKYFGGGYLSVEFFFIISGAFMARSISSDIKREGDISLRKALIPARKYLLKRIGSIFPYLLISTLIATIVRISSGQWSFNESIYRLVMLPSDLMLLQNYGFSTPSFTGIIWYLCASFFAMAVLYPIMRCCYDSYNRYYAPIVALLLVGIIQNYYATLNKTNEFLFQVFNTGFIRSIAMVSLGGFVYEVSVKLGNIHLSKTGLRLVTALEVILYVGVFSYMTLWSPEYAVADSFVVLWMALSVTLTLSGKSLIYGKMDCKLIIFLGKFSMVLFLNHYYWFLAARAFFGDVPVPMTFAAIGLSVLASFVVYFLGKRLTVIWRKVLSWVISE